MGNVCRALRRLPGIMDHWGFRMCLTARCNERAKRRRAVERGRYAPGIEHLTHIRSSAQSGCLGTGATYVCRGTNSHLGAYWSWSNLAKPLFAFRLDRFAVTRLLPARRVQTKVHYRPSQASRLSLDMRSPIHRILGHGDRMASDEVVMLRPAAKLALTMARGPLAPNSVRRHAWANAKS